MNARQRHTLRALFDEPVRSNIVWNDRMSLLNALDAEITEGRGSRVRIALGGVRAVFHRPHPHRVLGKGTVRSARRFLVRFHRSDDGPTMAFSER